MKPDRIFTHLFGDTDSNSDTVNALFTEPIPLRSSVEPGQPEQGPIFCTLALTRQEVQTIEHALSYYSQEMHTTGDEVKETCGELQSREWYTRATKSAAVLVALQKEIAKARRQAVETEAQAIQAKQEAQERADNTRRIIDATGKAITVFVLTVATLAALCHLPNP